MTPFFSIVIPTLNEEHYLPHILENLTQQKAKNFEIIIVDAKSDDRTKKVALPFTHVLPINFLEVAKRNVSYQRNYGATQARAPYLLFLDADAGISSVFTREAERIITNKKGLVFIPAIIPDERSYLDVRIVFNFINFIIEMTQNTGKPFASSGSMIFERAFFLKIGGFDEQLRLAEDHNVIQKAQQWGVKAKFIQALRIKFSLRRVRREGRLRYLYKFVLATAYVIFKGKIKKKLYQYEMGGHLYNLPRTHALREKPYTVQDYIEKINIYFKQLFVEE